MESGRGEEPAKGESAGCTWCIGELKEEAEMVHFGL